MVHKKLLHVIIVVLITQSNHIQIKSESPDDENSIFSIKKKTTTKHVHHDCYEHDQICCGPTQSFMTDQDSARSINMPPHICPGLTGIHHDYYSDG